MFARLPPPFALVHFLSPPRCDFNQMRADPVYHGHFKCNLKTLEGSYPNTLRWMRRVFQRDGVSATVDMVHIKKHYYMSHVSQVAGKLTSLQIKINPTQIVPLNDGPDLTLAI
jgi:putative glutathione S-transferase